MAIWTGSGGEVCRKESGLSWKKRWNKLPKGPEITEEEIEKIKERLVEDRELTAFTIRRLVQTLERHQYGTPHGYTEELPPVGSKVYIRDGYGDSFECLVLEHLDRGQIRVLDLSVNPPHGRKRVTSVWFLEP